MSSSTLVLQAGLVRHVEATGDPVINEPANRVAVAEAPLFGGLKLFQTSSIARSSVVRPERLERPTF